MGVLVWSWVTSPEPGEGRKTVVDSQGELRGFRALGAGAEQGGFDYDLHAVESRVC